MSTPITTAGWSRLTGSVAGRPASGSRTTALAKPDAAAFGAPGRTTTVGGRAERASRKPLRVASAKSSSSIALVAP